ncbi:unnamed protein product, partial [Ectocarpus sp. 12 AP-2014]
MPSTEPVPACPEYLLPSEEWEREVLSTFVDLRQVRHGRGLVLSSQLFLFLLL